MGGDDEIIYDEWEAFEDHETDRVLRQRFDRAFPIGDSSLAVLDEIRPVATRARRRYVAQRVVSFSVAASLLIGAGIVAFDQLVPTNGDGGAVFAGPADSGGGEGPDAGGGETSALPLPVPAEDGLGPTGDDDGGGQTVAGASSKGVDGPTTTTDPASQDSDATSSDPSSGSSTQSETTALPSTSQTPTSPTTTKPPTSSATATSLEGLCGYLTYDVEGYERISLVDAVSTSRYPVSIQADEQDRIMVSFDGAGRRCDLEVKFVDGELRTFVGGEDDDDDDDDHE